jgi:hypothetical protein
MAPEIRTRIGPLLLIAISFSAACAFAQGFPPAEPQHTGPNNIAEANRDAFEQQEAQRLENINRQIVTNEQLQWYRGGPNIVAGRYVYRDPPGLSYVYATGRRGILGGYRQSRWIVSSDPFTPWPYVPGDIWGWQDTNRVRQPIGRREIQTGPNRWESFPIYEEPIAPAPVTDRREF